MTEKDYNKLGLYLSFREIPTRVFLLFIPFVNIISAIRCIISFTGVITGLRQRGKKSGSPSLNKMAHYITVILLVGIWQFLSTFLVAWILFTESFTFTTAQMYLTDSPFFTSALMTVIATGINGVLGIIAWRTFHEYFSEQYEGHMVTKGTEGAKYLWFASILSCIIAGLGLISAFNPLILFTCCLPIAALWFIGFTFSMAGYNTIGSAFGSPFGILFGF